MSDQKCLSSGPWRAALGVIFTARGAEEAIVPVLWSENTFVAKAGGSEVLAQMWTFPDKKGRACCLIPEATALFQETARELLGRAKEKRFSYIARRYRYERPQAGQYREFTQLGFEYLSPDPEAAAAESLAIARGFLNSLGIVYECDDSARRGLTYYLGGKGFELKCPALGAQCQVAGGGAYREGAGFAIGLERLRLALVEQEACIVD